MQEKTLTEKETKELVTSTFDELLKLKVGEVNENEKISLMSYGGFDKLWKIASSFSASSIVPKDYQGNTPNCLVALEMAENVGVSALTVMQNLYIVHGKPAWSAQYIIAQINSCGRYSQLKYDVKKTGRSIKAGNKNIEDIEFYAYATEIETGDVLTSPVVTMQMAVDENWYGKTGSKWQTMPEIMGRYRAASFFGKLYCPDIMNGLQSADEITDSEASNPEELAKTVVEEQANSEEFNPFNGDQWTEEEKAEMLKKHEEKTEETMTTQASGAEPELDF